jgi:dTDP-4-amino-4,6-dideoxygalactose transaminase
MSKSVSNVPVESHPESDSSERSAIVPVVDANAEEFIPFTRPHSVGTEFGSITRAIETCELSGDGAITKRCHTLIEEALGVPKALLTTSCTHALEMSALLLRIKPGDEVIVPAFTFVSTANAFVLHGAKPVFADVRPDTLNMDETKLERLITKRTRAIVPVHYAGVGCEMDAIMSIAKKRGVAVVEDNAHGMFAKYNGKYLGTFGALATQSFHETKNFTCGEGGALLINDASLVERAEIIREKGTDRSRFYRGQVDKYSWRDVGSSFLPSGVLAAFLLEQLRAREHIQAKRRQIFETYAEGLRDWAELHGVKLPTIPAHCDQAYHMFYMLMPAAEARTELLAHLKARSIGATFHYVPLHTSPMGRALGGRAGDCPVTEDISERMIRLPFFADLTRAQQERVIGEVRRFSPARRRSMVVQPVRAEENEDSVMRLRVASAPVPEIGRRYLITVPAGARRLSPTTFAAESAFVQHLRELKQELGASWSEMVVAMAWLDDAQWEKQKPGLAVVDEAKENIRFVPMHRFECSKLEFAAMLPRLLPEIQRLVEQSDFVHSHFAYDLFRPIGAWFCFFASAMKKRVIAVDDIDRRQDAEMNYRTGRWSKRTYMMSKFVYDPVREVLQRAYVRNVDLMLFKETGQVEHYGRGSENVRLFLDPNFAEEHIVDDAFVRAKLADLAQPKRPLKLLYFGRLVPYKGVDKMLEAVAIAHKRGAHVTFDIMGAGEQSEALHTLADELEIGDRIQWIAPRSYGESFFEVLRERDVLLACPLSGDTPRSAWDALASAMPLVAFDTPFYKSMAEISHAVELTKWPEVEPLADKLVELAADKRALAPLVQNAVRTARENTGTSWLKRRVAWVSELMDKGKRLLAPLALVAHEWNDVICALA